MFWLKSCEQSGLLSFNIAIGQFSSLSLKSAAWFHPNYLYMYFLNISSNAISSLTICTKQWELHTRADARVGWGSSCSRK